MSSFVLHTPTTVPENVTDLAPKISLVVLRVQVKLWTQLIPTSVTLLYIPQFGQRVRSTPLVGCRHLKSVSGCCTNLTYLFNEICHLTVDKPTQPPSGSLDMARSRFVFSDSAVTKPQDVLPAALHHFLPFITTAHIVFDHSCTASNSNPFELSISSLLLLKRLSLYAFYGWSPFEVFKTVALHIGFQLRPSPRILAYKLYSLRMNKLFRKFTDQSRMNTWPA